MSIEKNEVKDFYKIMPSSFKLKTYNPNFQDTGIVIPAMIICIGGTGCKKTAWLLDLISRWCSGKGTFSTMDIILQNEDEPLYNYLRTRIEDGLTIVEGIENTPPLDEFDKEDNHLVVWDDMVLTNQKIVEQYYIRARKRNVTCIFISQSFHAIKKNIRLQSQYIILKKVQSMEDIKLILRNYRLGVSMDQLVKIYTECTKNPDDFLMIDLKAPIERKFRHNYHNIIDVSKIS